MATKAICSFPDCDKKVRAKGLCPMHYARARKYGCPTVVLSRRKPLKNPGFSCSRCDTENPRTPEFFSKLVNGRDGLHASCKECLAKATRLRRAASPEKFRDAERRRRDKGGDTRRASQRAASRRHYERHTALQRLQHRFRASISASLRIRRKGKQSVHKQPGWQKVLGYTVDDLYRHLEKQFTSKMTWANYGTYWHIDHVIPAVSFNYTSKTDPEFVACWALPNLRPLEKLENLKKNSHRTHLL